MTKKKDLLPQILDDSPSDEDAFGAHGRVANAIAELVQSNARGGKMIGLEGVWGSGKTTVIKRLKKRIDADKNCEIILFDAWAHDGDPLRRTFLETMINRLTRKEVPRTWVRRQYWNRKKEELAKRRKVKKTTRIPRAKPFGKLFGLSALLIPVGQPFVAAALQEENVQYWPNTGLPVAGKFLFEIGVAACLCLAPIWLVLLRWLCLRWKSWRSGDDPPDLLSWALFFSEDIREEESQTIESQDPTSLEFEKDFRNLMAEALDKPARRIVLVLDNLDRVGIHVAKSLWSTLQTFLQDWHSRDDSQWIHRLWIVVPYDSGGIRRIWPNNETSQTPLPGEDASHTGATPEPPEKGTSDKGTTADSFLDKSFQIRFEVPPPILSDWKSYLLTLFGEAFGESTDTMEFHRAYSVLASYQSVEEWSPTPRNLKLYVNQVVAVARQSAVLFPLEEIGYYVLLRRDRVSVVDELRSGEIPSKRIAELLREDAKYHLAAMAFNVDVDLAKQLLLAPLIRKALFDGEAENVRALEEQHERGFWPVLDFLVSNWASAPPSATQLARYVNSLQDAGSLERAELAMRQSVVDSLCRSAQKVDSWAPFAPETAKGVCGVCSLRGDKTFAASIVRTLSANLEEAFSDQKGDIDHSELVDSLMTIVRGLHSAGLTGAIADGLPLPFQVEGENNLFTAIDHITKDDISGEFWGFFRILAGNADVVTALSKAIGGGNLDETHYGSVRFLVGTEHPVNWQDVLVPIEKRLAAPNDLAPAEVVLLLRILYACFKIQDSAQVKPARDLWQRLAKNGHIHHHFHSMRSHSDNVGTAWCLFAVLLGFPGGKHKPTAKEGSNTGPGHATLQQLLQTADDPSVETYVAVLNECNSLPLLWKTLDKNPDTEPFIGTCIRYIAAGELASKFFTPEVCVQRSSFLRNVLVVGPNLGKLVMSLLSDAKFVSGIMGISFSPHAADAYTAVLRALPEHENEFASWCHDGLNTLGRDDWIKQFKEDGAVLCLLIELVEGNERKTHLKSSYDEALIKHAEEVLAGEAVAAHLMTRWDTLLDAIADDGARALFCRQLCSLIVQASGEIPDDFVAIYGNEIAAENTLLKEDKVVSDLFIKILQGQKPKLLEWLANFSETHSSQILGHPDQDAVTVFKRKLAEPLPEDILDEVAELSQRIADALGIEQTPPAAATEDEDAETDAGDEES